MRVSTPQYCGRRRPSQEISARAPVLESLRRWLRRTAARSARPPASKPPMVRLYEEFDWAAGRPPTPSAIPSRTPTAGSGGRRAPRRVPRLWPCQPLRPLGGWALERMGPSPARVRAGVRPPPGRGLRGLPLSLQPPPPDLVAFCAAAGGILRAHGSLGAFFAAGYSPEGRHGGARARALRGRVPLAADRGPLPAPPLLLRVLSTLLPAPSTGGALQAPALYLRWMIRGSRRTSGCGPASRPRPRHPGGYHIEHMARAVGLTTPAQPQLAHGGGDHEPLRLLDPADPVEVRLRALPQAHVGRLPGPRDGRRLRACRPPAGLAHWRGWRPLERPA
jgi:hypothetical protein